MGSGVATGLFALGGTLIGGFASYAAAAVQVRSQRENARERYNRQLLDLRRQTYADFLSKADVVTNLIKEIHVFDTPVDVPANLQDRYAEAWGAFVTSTATTRVVGPDHVADEAQALRVTLAAMANRIDAWLRGGPWDQKAFDHEDAERKENSAAFLKATRGALASR